MPTYVPYAIKKIKHIFSGKPQDTPASHITPKSSERIQYSETENITEALQQDEIYRIQMIVGIFLYYALAIDNTNLQALGYISSEQPKATKNTDAKVIQFLSYIFTHRLDIIEYHASEMILHVSSDASYN